MNRLYISHTMVISKYYSSIHNKEWKEGSSIGVHLYTIYLLGIQ